MFDKLLLHSCPELAALQWFLYIIVYPLMRFFRLKLLFGTTVIFAASYAWAGRMSDRDSDCLWLSMLPKYKIHIKRWETSFPS